MERKSNLRCLLDKVTVTEWGALSVAGIALLIGVGLDVSDQPLYEGSKIFGLIAVALLLLCGVIPATVRCASSWKMVWTVVVVSTILMIMVLVVFYVAYFWAIDGVPLEERVSDRILNLPPVITALWAAAMGWYVHFQATAKNHRTTNSFNLVMQSRTSGEFLRASKAVQLVWPHGTVAAFDDRALIESKALGHALELVKQAKAAGDEAVLLAARSTLKKARAADALRYILNYFEFMAVGVRAKDLEESMLYETIGTNVCSIYARAKHFLEYVRSVDGGNQPLAFEHLDELVTKWKDPLEKEAFAKKNGKK